MPQTGLAELSDYAFPIDDAALSLHDESAELTEWSNDNEEEEDTLAQPWITRRDAVVSEYEPPDPTYWYSPSKFVVEKTPETRETARRELLEKHPWFSIYSPFIKRLFEEALEVKAFEAGEVVSEPGKDEAFFYLLHGSVELVPQEELEARTKDPRASTWLNKRSRVKRRKGEDFGREGLLHILCGERFSYTTIALIPCMVLGLRRSVYKKIMMVNYLEPHDFLENTIRYVRVFDNFSDAEKSRVAKTVEKVHFQKGHTILQEKVAPTKLFIIQSGCVEVTTSLPSGLRAQVKLLVPSECVGDAEIFSFDNKSLYDYVAYEDVTALALEEEFLYKFHGNPLLQHLFGTVNVEEIQNRKTLVEEFKKRDAYLPVDLLESEADADETAANGNRTCPEETDDENDVLDSDEEERYLTPVNMKSSEVTIFLLDHFYSRREYRQCGGVQRGISLTAFSSPRHIKCGTVLFNAEPATQPGECEAVVRARRLRRRKDKPTFDNNEQFLYVVYQGTIELLDRDGERIATIIRGGSVGEHRLLKKISAACEVTATVVSPDGCDILRLPRKVYRSGLMESYAEEFNAFMKIFKLLPFASGFPESYLLAMHQYMDTKEIGTASVLLAENVNPREVFIMYDGKVQIRSSLTSEIHYVQYGDTIGGLEVMDGVKSRAAFVTEGKAHVLRIPAEQFLSMFRFGTAFVDHLRETARYRNLYGSGWKK